MNQKMARALQNEAVVALQTVASKYGLTVVPKNGRLTDISVTLKFEFQGVTPTGETSEVRHWKTYATAYGLQPEWLGASIVLRGKPYKILGLLAGRRKNNVSVARSDGKRFVLPHTNVIAQMKLREVA